MSGGWAGSSRSKRLPKNWPKRRARILKRDPVCRACKARASVQVDHVQRGDDHSDANLQGLCGSCHAVKTQREASQARHRFKKERKSEKHPGLA